MNANEPTPGDDQCASWLAVCDEALAQGQSPSVLEHLDVPPNLRPRLQKALGCLQRLKRAWTHPPDDTPSTALPPLLCPVCGHVRESDSLPEWLEEESVQGATLWPPRAEAVLRACPDTLQERREGFLNVRIPGYQILAELGRGGMGVVYKARQLGLKRLVALKMILAAPFAGAAEFQRFRTEAEAAARLQHPQIVPIYEVGEMEGLPYLTLEWMPGGSLAQKMGGKPQPPGAAAQLVAQLARAMHYAHQQGIIHRDLKPANILLAADGTPKIGDFGLAKIFLGLGSDLRGLTPPARRGSPGVLTPGSQTQSGAVVGTPSYMAPEQAAGRPREVGPATDVYALGAILYEMLTGRPPFQGETPLETLLQVRGSEPVPPSRFQPRMPRDLETICLKCLAKEPRRRYATAQALAEDLERFGSGRPILARPIHPLERLLCWCRRNPLPATLTGAVAVLLLTLAVGGFMSAAGLAKQRDAAQLNLAHSKLEEARAIRQGNQADRRSLGLQKLAEATAFPSALDTSKVRNETIACLALPDFHCVKRWQGSEVWGDKAVVADAQLKLYVYGDQGVVHVRRVSDNQEIARLTHASQSVQVVRFSPDDRYLAVTGDPYKANQKIYVWEMAKPRQPVLVEGYRGQGLVDFSPDSRQLAAYGTDGAITLYQLPSGAAVRRLPPGPTPHSLAFHPRGRKLAVSVVNQPIVQVHDLDCGHVTTLRHPREVRGLAWRPDGKCLATACGDCKVYVWDLAACQPAAILEDHQGVPTAVAFDPSGNLLAANGWDQQLCIWDLASRKLVADMRNRRLLRFGSQGGRLCLVTGSKLELWEKADSRECRVLHTGQQVTSVDFSPDGRRLVSGDTSGVRLWDVASTRSLGFLHLGRSVAVFSGPEAPSLITSTGRAKYRWPIREDNAAGRTTLRIGPPQNLGLASPSSGLGLSPDRQALAVVMGDRVTLLTGSGLTARTISGSLPGIGYVAVSPNGEWVATGAWRGKGTQIWRAKDHALVQDWPDMDEAQIAFSPNGRWLVTGTAKEFNLWEAGSWQRLWTLAREENQNFPGLVAFSPDSRVLAAATSMWDVQLLDPTTKQEFARLTTPDRPFLHCLAFSPDGSRFAVGATGSIFLWDLRLLREELRKRGLEGNWPEYSPPDQAAPPEATQVQVFPGELSFFRQRPKGTPASLRQEIQRFTEGLAREPGRIDLYEARGTRHVLLKEYDQAAADYEKALELDPDRAGTCRNLAWVYLVGPEPLRRPERALALAQRAAHLLPEGYIIHNTLGLAYYRTGQWSAAVETLEDASAANNEGANAYDLFFLAMCYGKLGQPAKARDHFERALQWIQAQDDLAPLAVERLESFRREAAELLGAALLEREIMGQRGDS